MLKRVRVPLQRVLGPLGAALASRGVNPNVVTLIGALGVSASALVLYPRGDLFWGSFAITIFVLIVLYVFGGGAIHDFALTLILGMVVGTYSSIYIASPVTLVLRDYRRAPGADDDATPVDDAPRRRKQGKKKGSAQATA